MNNTKLQWDASLYENKHAFVWNSGADLIKILAPQSGERILDLGCGTGQLTSQLAKFNTIMTGIDSSPAMINQATKNYPDLQFFMADGADFDLKILFDAVFSNAALHWIKEPELAIRCIWKSLKPGGRFVAEFGAHGNVKRIINTVENVLSESGYSVNPELNPWYFSSISEYSNMLERQGFEVTCAEVFNRPTCLEDGEQGMYNWLKMFGNTWLSIVPKQKEIETIEVCVEKLRPHLYQESSWFVDYKRLRIVARKLTS